MSDTSDDRITPAAPATSPEVREGIVRKLRRDMIGPSPDPIDGDLAEERLSQSEPPSSWYMTGFLVPDPDAAAAEDEASLDAVEEKEAQQRQEEIEAVADIEGETSAEPADASDAGAGEAEEETKTVRRLFPSSLGLTVTLPPDVASIEAVITWGDYRPEPPVSEEEMFGEDPLPGSDGSGKGERLHWVRTPREARVTVPVHDAPNRIDVPESSAPTVSGGGLALRVHNRLFDIPTVDGGTTQVRTVTVFLINYRPVVSRKRYRDATYAFQATLSLECPSGFAPRYNLSQYRSDDPDLRVADLHYRDVAEYAVGRNVGADWECADAAGVVRRVWSEPLPKADVPRFAPNTDITSAEFGMAALADLAAAEDGEALAANLRGLAADYADWIAGQRERVGSIHGERRREVAGELCDAMEKARNRIADGVELLRTDARARTAFRIMNRAIDQASRRRIAFEKGVNPAEVSPPRWRPFQLAYILLNIRAMVEPAHDDREIVDLLFFPTGGGKTEAYLGLAAFTIAHRRLSNGGVLGAGVAVIMRYTLRLLTLDQLARTAGVICALELQRLDPANVDANGKRLLGDWPIEIGLWVGDAASPNRLGQKGDTGLKAEKSARKRVKDYTKGKTDERPAPLEACPWCGESLGKDSFAMVPNDQAPQNMEIRCANPDCAFTGDRPLPVVTVDEAIYRRLPAFVIATVDKFAGLPWLGQAGAFFGHVNRFREGVGFYGAAEDDAPDAAKLHNDNELEPPQLIIQDELHLISGPLGTVAGLYETAVDRLASRRGGPQGRIIRPKIVASTATVRRAESQIRALFDREHTAIFPPPGVNRQDSFFARTVSTDDEPPRWYLGIAAQGRGPKLIFLRTLTRLVAAAQAAYDAAGGARPDNPADPYMTAVAYFNALRELGGARRIVEDEVRNDARFFGDQRQRVHPSGPVFGNRDLRQPLELTSRVSTNDVSAAKRALERPFDGQDEPVDVTLATNMISVGLDITRLGLMLVQGQPKTAAEYIQSTSRVGRDPNRPGLVATILNLHKPRDRMHYEQFGHFHRTFYRAVEATSVTPWAARAIDRALAAVVVALARHIDADLTPENAATELRDRPDVQEKVREAITARARHSGVTGGEAAVRQAVDELMANWIEIAAEKTQDGGGFAYTHEGAKQHLLYPPLHPDVENLDPRHRHFIAGRSMRDVEANAPLEVRDPQGNELGEKAKS